MTKVKTERETKEQMNGCTFSTICGKEVEWDPAHIEAATVSGVFAPLINNASFLDKVTLGINGKLRKRFPKNN